MPKKLSEQELADILQRAEREYDYSGPATSRSVDVEALLDHIEAVEAEYKAAMQRAGNDAYENGLAVGEFIDQQTKRIEALETVARGVVEWYTQQSVYHISIGLLAKVLNKNAT